MDPKELMAGTRSAGESLGSAHPPDKALVEIEAVL